MISGTQLFLICLFLTLLAFGLTESYSGPRKFSLTAFLAKDILGASEPLEFNVILTNPTKRALYAGTGQNGGITLQALTAAGKDTGLSFKTDIQVTPIHKKNRIEIPPGEKLEFVCHFIPEQSPLTPGTYRLRLSIRDLQSGADVHSPFLQLTVVA